MVSSLSPETSDLVDLASQLVLAILFPPPGLWDYRQTTPLPWLFTWVLGILDPSLQDLCTSVLPLELSPWPFTLSFETGSLTKTSDLARLAG